jgi:hypothetical protein
MIRPHLSHFRGRWYATGSLGIGSGDTPLDAWNDWRQRCYGIGAP